MKKALLILTLCLILTGCTGNTGGNSTPSTQATTPSTTPSTGATEPSGSTGASDPTESTGGDSQQATESVSLLQKIWDAVPEAERFSAYGGTVEHSTENAPGPLDVTDAEELTTKYLIPQDQLTNITEAASLVHLMNSNIFTGAAFRLAENADAEAFAKALRDNLQKTEWICGQPDRLLIGQMQNHLVMAFGEQELMTSFQTVLTQVYPDAKLLYTEAVTE